ncbi:hypothetical protein TrCOL_g4854 [Triparma columacea]|uniref:EF-hand domain-containing protein n=1 Tax=Triparma columacea TaxID=722753 RepID=A0A9W7GM91_9STRA|nr:hypothetical protein TrCOL_g4854 [Triparma columacea]
MRHSRLEVLLLILFYVTRANAFSGSVVGSSLRRTRLHSKKDDVTKKIEDLMKKTKFVDSDYKFGDLSKKTLSSTFAALDQNGDGVVDAGEIADAAKSTIEAAAKATRIVDEDYEFGDITKKATEMATNTAEKTVKTITGDEGYKFGDYTQKFLTDGDKALKELREEAFNQIPKQVWSDMLGDLTEQQREAVAISLIQLAATAVLAFNLAMNFVTSITWMRAWKVVASTTKVSPWLQWSKLLQARTSVEAIISPIALPLAAAFTLFLLIPYKDFVESLEKRLPLKRRFPVVNRMLAIVVSCLTVNIAAVGSATSAVFWVLNRIYVV